MYKTNHPIILASASPRRQEFLKWLGIKHTIQTADIDETRRQGESPPDYVLRLAKEKGRAVAAHSPSSFVISGDTTVSLGNTIFNKPENEEAAVAMLLQLAGRTHTVLSAFSVINISQNHFHSEIVQTKVTFIPFSEEIARAYTATGEPLDKAGAYGIQQCGVSLVAKIDGSYSNVVGLPLSELVQVLLEWGVISPKRGFTEKIYPRNEKKMQIL